MRGTGTGSAATLNWVLPEANNSTVITANAAGTVQKSFAYDAYGNTTPGAGADTNSQQYTGRENDGNGLYYYRNRYYLSGCMRFISEDPLGWASGQTNNYAYVKGNPVQFADSYGLKPGDSFCSMDAAALDALAYMNPASIARDVEYGTVIKEEVHWFGPDTFTYDKIFHNIGSGAGHEVDLSWRSDEGVVAVAHTHAAFHAPTDNYFSQHDKDNADSLNITNYVATPSGNFYKYSPRPLGSPLTEVGATQIRVGGGGCR
jgi:RHS repeat-associated protein